MRAMNFVPIGLHVDIDLSLLLGLVERAIEKLADRCDVGLFLPHLNGRLRGDERAAGDTNELARLGVARHEIGDTLGACFFATIRSGALWNRENATTPVNASRTEPDTRPLYRSAAFVLIGSCLAHSLREGGFTFREVYALEAPQCEPDLTPCA